MFTYNFLGTKAELDDKCVGESVHTNEAFYVDQTELEKIQEKLDKPVVSYCLYKSIYWWFILN